MPHRPLSVSITLAFMLLSSLVWLVFGIIVAANLHPSLPATLLIKGLIAALSFIVVLILLALFTFLRKRNRIAFYLALLFLLVATLVNFLDDVGWVDLAIIAISLIPLLLLIKDRSWYLSPRTD